MQPSIEVWVRQLRARGSIVARNTDEKRSPHLAPKARKEVEGSADKLSFIAHRSTLPRLQLKGNQVIARSRRGARRAGGTATGAAVHAPQSSLHPPQEGLPGEPGLVPDPDGVGARGRPSSALEAGVLVRLVRPDGDRGGRGFTSLGGAGNYPDTPQPTPAGRRKPDLRRLASAYGRSKRSYSPVGAVLSHARKPATALAE